MINQCGAKSPVPIIPYVGVCVVIPKCVASDDSPSLDMLKSMVMVLLFLLYIL